MVKKYLFIFFIFLISGCGPGFPLTRGATDYYNDVFRKNPDWDESTKKSLLAGELQFGMTKKQVFFLFGSPDFWTRYETKDGIFETWFYNGIVWSGKIKVNSCDFKDDSLVGYSGGANYNRWTAKGCYYTKDKIIDVRQYEK